jgi:hypothetical protein
MDRGRVGEDRGSKETDGCPLTAMLDIKQQIIDAGEMIDDLHIA